MPIIHLPEPAAARVISVAHLGDQIAPALGTTSPAAYEALQALLQKAMVHGYAIEIKLIHYEGLANADQQREARKAEKKRKEQP